MLLDSTNVKTETNCNAIGNTFKISASPIAFDILSSKLYSDPILAIVRELCTNAYDSHKAAGKEDVPIKINLPSYMEPNFIIRDYGIGLSKEDVMDLYTTFFSSTKSDSNDFTGCFGLGSKTPFSYTSSFSVNSYWNGTKYYFIATKKDGLPHIFFIKEEPTEEENGLEISIPTDKNGDFDQKFYLALSDYLKYIPEIKVKTEKEIWRRAPLIVRDKVSLYDKERQTNPWESNQRTGVCIIKQGQNVYKVSEFIDKYFSEDDDIKILLHFLNYCDIVVSVPIGTLSITPSREALSQEEENTAKVKEQIREVNDYLKFCLVENISSFNIPGSNLNKVYDEIMTDKYFDKEHPLRPKISTRHAYVHQDTDKATCSIGECHLHRVDYDGLSKNGTFVQDKKCIVLLVPAGFNHGQVQKLKNTINNYDELEDKNIYIAMTYSGRLYKENLLHFARNLKKTINTLNSIVEYNFDIEYRTINSFYREYTNHKKQRDVSFDPSEKRVRYKQATTCLDQSRDLFNKGTISIELLKDRHDVENTLIVFKDPKESFKWNTVGDKLTVIGYFIRHIKDKEGNNFTLDYLKSLLPQLEDHSSLTVIEVSKTVKKYFKEYEITSFNKIFDMIQEADWTISVNPDTDLVKFLEGFDEMFLYNFKPKAYNYITKTKSYKKLCILRNIVQKDANTKNPLKEYELDKIQKYLPNVMNRKVTSLITSVILSTKLKELFWLFDGAYLTRSGLYYSNRKEWLNSNIPIYREISKANRLKILHLLKGDI